MISNIASGSPATAAAGGGLCCQQCGAVSLKDSRFISNFATSAGGATAIMLPTGNVSVTGNEFTSNAAAAEAPLNSQEARRLLELLQAGSLDSDDAASLAVLQGQDKIAPSSFFRLLGDDMLYK
ncbi:hypothetical protein MNEG_3554 [Monoraphidium neglectum]|uniref:Uncharacterized protein n=1 Tax=Monoraphidium neglectum TaxID=145388 RepID=A0A0D2MV63_9CHLO|nr:hypothetical protein MNEG_3554 [Monoraphidium neglectum]KIZ04407.1 hypothetical protein MNEG_3554 [Monoraphidium neglectum]|eukprot:XP_013903426.1 hypothetical protein MNEG_3554 [Monoraphidium neglectum]